MTPQKERPRSSSRQVEEAYLGEQLGGGGSTDDGSGIAEALQAWAAGGHTVEGADDSEEIKPVQFAQLEPPPPVTAKPKLRRLDNVYVDIIVELGRRDMTVRQLLNLKEQDVIDLDKLAGESFEILINSRLFAEGEIVVVTDIMAVRITRMIEKGRPEDEES
ncbi:MAG: FliM/FliN family flagellar motor switch protein [Gemmatimonadota bacterium]